MESSEKRGRAQIKEPGQGFQKMVEMLMLVGSLTGLDPKYFWFFDEKVVFFSKKLVGVNVSGFGLLFVDLTV